MGAVYHKRKQGVNKYTVGFYSHLVEEERSVLNDIWFYITIFLGYTLLFENISLALREYITKKKSQPKGKR